MFRVNPTALIASAALIWITIQLQAAAAPKTACPSMQKVVYGHSVEGRPLVAYILGSGKFVTLISGGIHGNETSVPTVVEKLRTYLYDDPREWTGEEVIVVPRVNPDGDALHTRANADGVDLNRNFPYQWSPKSARVRLSTGSSALSEPETRGLLALMDEFHPEKAISIHQPLHCLIWSGPSGKLLAAAMHAQNGYPVTDNVGYPTPGSFGGYCWHVRHIPAVTLELPWESADAAWSANKSALIAAIRFPIPAN